MCLDDGVMAITYIPCCHVLATLPSMSVLICDPRVTGSGSYDFMLTVLR